uniref:Uncharacterized protein n=1 Tax=Arundo donax TaxID=35708 RepID=A0A0A9D4F8_ARUDO
MHVKPCPVMPTNGANGMLYLFVRVLLSDHHEGMIADLYPNGHLLALPLLLVSLILAPEKLNCLHLSPSHHLLYSVATQRSGFGEVGGLRRRQGFLIFDLQKINVMICLGGFWFLRNSMGQSEI